MSKGKKRGAAPEVRDEFVQVRLTKAEKEKAEELMWSLRERGLSSVLRRLLQDAPMRKKRRAS